jgi:hypothetical protein
VSEMTASAIDELETNADLRVASSQPRAVARIRSMWDTLRARAWVWLLNILTFVGLGAMLYPDFFTGALHGTVDLHTKIDEHYAFLVLCACAAPPFLAALAYSLISKRASANDINLDFPKDLDPGLVERAISCWVSEIERSCGSMARAESFASLWGLLTTMMLVGAVTFLLPPFHTPPDNPFSDARNMVAFAVIGAAGTRFMLDLSRICIRISNDDVSKRMFAEALRVSILSVIATLALTFITGLASKDPESAGLPVVLRSMGLGAGVAIVGVPVFDYVVLKVSDLLGVSRPEQPLLTPLTALAGMSAADIDRLGEEGIVSVEALIGTPPPRIFMNTRFSLKRICDWVDRGLLLSRLGATAVASLHDRAGLTGALELRQLVADGHEGRTAATLAAIKKAMSLDGDEEAQLLLSAIVLDDSLAMLATFHRTPLGDTRESAVVNEMQSNQS